LLGVILSDSEESSRERVGRKKTIARCHSER